MFFSRKILKVISFYGVNLLIDIVKIDVRFLCKLSLAHYSNVHGILFIMLRISKFYFSTAITSKYISI